MPTKTFIRWVVRVERIFREWVGIVNQNFYPVGCS